VKIKEGDSATAFTNGYKREQNPGANYSSSEYVNYNKVAKGELFYFDPNIATADEWKRFGTQGKKQSSPYRSILLKVADFTSRRILVKSGAFMTAM
jgi:hypothetical protein